MLTHIRIQSLGVIEQESVQLHPGLTVLTGETGAGKTMVITGLRLLTGVRADSNRIRSDASRALVEGRFDLSDITDTVREDLEAYISNCGGQLDDDGSVIAVRSLTRTGNAQAYLGGCSVPVKTLGGLTQKLLVIHGQHDQLRLAKPEQQRSALDRFAHTHSLLEQYRSIRHEWLQVCQQLEQRERNARQLAQESDQLIASLQEIETIDPQIGEEEELAQEIRRLSDLDSLRSIADEACQILMEDVEDHGPGPVIPMMSKVIKILEMSQDRLLEQCGQQLREALIVITDAHEQIAQYCHDLPADESTLEARLARQASLRMLTRKYGSNVAEILEWATQARHRLAKIDISPEALAELTQQAQQLSDQLAQVGEQLSRKRHQAAHVLSQQVSQELAGLAMGKAQFEVSVSPLEVRTGEPRVQLSSGEYVYAGPDGMDTVEFGLASRPGSPMLALAKAASGGELSRVMLAVELVLAHSSQVPHTTTMIFDEIDTGVGGKTAGDIGRRLAQIARQHQVIVVTHLPQVAAYADHHLMVEIKEDQDHSSHVRCLNEQDRREELARMLAGLENSQLGQAHAQELLETAHREKQSWC